MEIYIEKLSKEEYIELFKNLNVHELRKPIISDKKLTKKYVSGFRPANMPLQMIASAYYSEVRSGNIVMREKLIDCIKDYLKDISYDCLKEKILGVDSAESSVECGFFLAEQELNINVSLFIKIVGIDLKYEYLVIINQCYERHRTQMVESNSKIEILEEQIKEKNQLIEQKNEDISNAKKKYKQIERALKEEKNKNLRYQEEIEGENHRIEELNIQLLELSNTISKKNTAIEEYECSININKDRIASLERQFNALAEVKDSIEEERDRLKEQRMLEYEKIIVELVKETIVELGDRFSLSETQFNEIVQEIEEPHTVAKVWKKISHNNQEIIDDIEIALKKQNIDRSIIDQCDDIENNLLVKYMSVKAIRAAIYEYMSYVEINSNISDAFKGI